MLFSWHEYWLFFLARIKAGLFCLRHLFKGYRTETFYYGFHGPGTRVQLVNGNKLVRRFYERRMTDEERLAIVTRFANKLHEMDLSAADKFELLRQIRRNCDKLVLDGLGAGDSESE